MDSKKKQSPSVVITATPKDHCVEFYFSIDHRKCLDDISSSMWQALMSWRESHTSDVSEVDAVAQCLLQMMIVKARTFKSILEGVSLLPEDTEGRRILDIPSIAAVIRSIYEFAFLFHVLFIKSEGDKERDILMYIWKIRGFNNRVNQETPDMFKEKQESELADINEYRKKAKDIVAGLDIIESERRKLIKAIESDSCMMSGYQFVKNADDVIVQFKNVNYTNASALFEHDNYAILYNYLSSLSHPSFLGVLQFGQMYNANKEKDFADSFIWIACICLSKFLKDFCMVVSDGDRIKEEVIGSGWSTINLFSGF